MLSWDPTWSSVQLYSLKYKKGMELLDQVQRRPESEYSSTSLYGVRLIKLCLLTLQKRRLWGDFVTAFQLPPPLAFAGEYRRAGEGLFTTACSARMANSFKLEEPRLRGETSSPRGW